MWVSDLKGFKYPDVELVRWFFKQGLDRMQGKVLEFGSHNGNNLSLFASYDYECLGVDLDETNIANANFNFKEVIKAKKFEFFKENILDFAAQKKGLKADIFLIPNVINYLERDTFLELLRLCKENEIYKTGADFFMRTRSIKDYRYGLSKKIAHNSFLIEDDDTTGEKGCINTLYQEYELVEIFKEYFKLYDFKVLTYESLNVMGEDERLVNDCDIVIYGKIK